LNLVYVGADKAHEKNCTQHNIERPARAVNKLEGYHADVIDIDMFTANSPETQNIISKADAVIIERNYFNDTLALMQLWKGRAQNLIAVFDDAYDIMHRRNVAYPFWKHGELSATNENGKIKRVYANPKPLDMFAWGCQIVKAIQVPSRYLQQDWSRFNDTYLVHNYIEAEKYIDIKPLYPHKDSIIIGWGGSLSHLASFTDSGALKAMKRVVHKYKNVKVMISGDKRVFDEVDLPVGKKLYQPFVPEEQFLPLIKTFDIAIAPLCGEYDKRRSRIKVLEYCALQIPFIASDYPPYEEMKEYGTYVNNTSDEWEEALCHTIDKLKEKQEFAKGIPFEWAMSQSYDKNISKTLDLYQKIINTPYKGYDYIINKWKENNANITE